MPQDLRRQALASVLPQDYRLDRLGVTIRAAEPSDLPTISCLRSDEPERARRRLDSQESGHVLYLLALINNLPVVLRSCTGRASRVCRWAPACPIST